MSRTLLVPLTAFAFLALAPCAFGDEERVSKTVALEPGGTVELHNFSGRVTVTASDRAEVEVNALRRGSRDRLDHIKLDVHANGSTVVIEANRRDAGWRSWLSHNNVVETDLDVKVPRKTNLHIQVFSSPVDVKSVEGSYDVHSFSGGIHLDNAAGPIRIHSFSGAIDIRAREWQTDQAIDVDTFSGGIDLHVPEAAQGTINFHSFSGNLTSDMPLSLNSTSRRSVTAKLGSGDGGSLRLKTFSGNVRIDR